MRPRRSALSAASLGSGRYRLVVQEPVTGPAQPMRMPRDISVEPCGDAPEVQVESVAAPTPSAPRRWSVVVSVGDGGSVPVSARYRLSSAGPSRLERGDRGRQRPAGRAQPHPFRYGAAPRQSHHRLHSAGLRRTADADPHHHHAARRNDGRTADGRRGGRGHRGDGVPRRRPQLLRGRDRHRGVPVHRAAADFGQPARGAAELLHRPGMQCPHVDSRPASGRQHRVLRAPRRDQAAHGAGGHGQPGRLPPAAAGAVRAAARLRDRRSRHGGAGESGPAGTRPRQLIRASAC